MNTAKKSIYNTIPYLKRRFKGIRYGYRPRKYAYAAADGECLIATISDELGWNSIYGKRVKKGIRYLAYSDEDEYGYPAVTAPGPFSLGELIDYMDDCVVLGDGERGLGIIHTILNYRHELGNMNVPSYEMVKELINKYMNYTKVSSDYYEQIGDHYDYVQREWAKDMLAEWEGPATPERLGSRLILLIDDKDKSLAEQLRTKYEVNVRNTNFYYMLSPEEADEVDHLLGFK